MDKMQLLGLIIVGVAIGFVLILREMFKWNSALKQKVESLSAEKEELKQVLDDRETSLATSRDLITELEQLVEKINNENNSLRRFIHIRDTTQELERLNSLIVKNEAESKDKIRNILAAANSEAADITEKARIYAENPEKGFLPSIGKLIHLRTPAAAEFTRDATVRIDAGVIEGDEITAHYDPMIAKLIVWGDDRSQALARMSAALTEFEVVGPSTNIAFLGRLITSQPFSNADLDTGLIERHYDELFPAAPTPSLSALCLAAVMLTLDERTPSADPWSQPTAWRMNSHLSRDLSFSDASGEHALTMSYAHDNLVFRSGHAECVVRDSHRNGTQLSINMSGKKNIGSCGSCR